MVGSVARRRRSSRPALPLLMVIATTIATATAGGRARPLVAQQTAAAAPLVFDGVTVIDVESGARVPGQEAMAPGWGAHQEMAIMVAEGMTPLAALQAGTINPIKAMRLTDSLGTVAAGKLADLVLLDADPLVDITNTTAILAVVANGRYFDRPALDQVLDTVRNDKMTARMMAE